MTTAPGTATEAERTAGGELGPGRGAAAEPAAGPGPQPPRDLARRAGRGFVWQVGFTLTAKAFSTVGNIALAWLLMPGDFGLVAMTWTVVSVAGLVQDLRAQDVLVQRQARLRRWATPAFWMALLAGLAGMVVAIAAVPLATRIYNEPRLGGMVAVLSLMLPLRALLIVPQANLAARLRFRTDAVIHGSTTMLTMLLSIVLAAAGLGPYALVVPVPLVLAAQAAVMWSVAPVRIRPRPQLRRWRFLIGDVGYSWGVSALIVLILQADYIALSVYHSAAVVGLYFLAFNLSTQVFSLLVTNLMNVLLPSLSLLGHDRERQTRGYLEASRLVMAVGLPACLGLAAIAEPLVSIAYPDDYAGVAPLLAALAIGIGLYLPAGPAISMMKAQGRFRALFLAFLVNAAVMAPLLLWAAGSHDSRSAAVWVACAAAAVYGVFGPLFVVITTAGSIAPLLALRRVYAGAMLASLVAIGTGLAASLAVPPEGGSAVLPGPGALPGPLPEGAGPIPGGPGVWSDVMRLAVIVLVAVPLYLVFVRWISPGLWSSLLLRVRTTPLLGDGRAAGSDDEEKLMAAGA
jgi:PST family polysaccharide transporter